MSSQHGTVCLSAGTVLFGHFTITYQKWLAVCKGNFLYLYILVQIKSGYTHRLNMPELDSASCLVTDETELAPDRNLFLTDPLRHPLLAAHRALASPMPGGHIHSSFRPGIFGGQFWASEALSELDARHLWWFGGRWDQLEWFLVEWSVCSPI